MLRLIIAMLTLPFAAATVAQQSRLPTARQDIEFRTTAPAVSSLLEIQIPNVASGQSQKRMITDLMVRIVLPGGDVQGALRLPNSAIADRDEGLFRAHVYIVSGGRLLRDAEARCDRWLADFAVCKLPCEGGAFGLKRRSDQGLSAVTLMVGKLPRGSDEGERLGFSISGCSDAAREPELLLAPSRGRSLAEVPLRSG